MIRLGVVGLYVMVNAACFLHGIAHAELRYTPAFLDYRDELELFPLNGEAFTRTLPMAPSRLVYAPDGKSLYTFGDARDRASRGLSRIEFDPPRVTLLPNSDQFRAVNSFTLSLQQDMVVISGKYGDNVCGIFELDLNSGEVRVIVKNSTCDYSQSWVRMNLSPDSKRLVAYRRPDLELIDLATGAIQSLGGKYVAGAWSPDGKWLAALEGEGQSHTVLLDANSLARGRVFGTSNVQWSPDSHYLLGERTRGCLAYWASIVVIDVDTGQEQTVASSHCKVNLTTTGWVSNLIVP